MIEREGYTLRHELKYNLNTLQYHILRKKLEKVLRLDPHAGPDGLYHIRSLYFDDFRNRALYEKQAGISRRKKYRIRIYNFTDNVIKLECKNKLDQYISKESATLTREETDRILAGDVDFLKERDNRLLTAFYLEHKRNLLRPNVIVDYYREAYVHPVGNVRITFDMGLHTGMNSKDLFSKDVCTVGIDDHPIILEIKYDNLLPEMVRGLLPGTIQPRSAIGKFVMRKRFTKCNDWEDQ
ncbi:MAG TPA: polyphosphate polymerase domain-containing protein [Candidatus Methanofastidiosa archaeon]|nr:polyphosphate polymerase domain-containing protein [Candidatus Methanofastidiosa archaeon]